MAKSSLVEGSVCFILQPQFHTPSRWEISGRNLKAETEAVATEECCLLVYFHDSLSLFFYTT